MKKMIPTLVLLAVCGSSPATTITFDFDSGIDLASFSVFNVGELFTISTEGQDLRISKPEDDGTVLPLGFILGGIESTFTIDGDFSVTVDFTLHDFPPTGGPCCPLNEALLRVEPEDGSAGFMIYRLRIVDGNLISTWIDGVGVIGEQSTTITSGRFRITRSGTTLSAWFSVAKGAFVQLGIASGWGGSSRIRLYVAQGKSVSGISRSTTSIDVSYDNLVIEADEISTHCLTDVDGDDIVGIGDFLLVLAQWGPCPPDCFADVDGDGEVGILDLLLVLADWGPCL